MKERITTKIDPEKNYTKDNVCGEISKLFPHLSKKGLEVSLYHLDKLAGN